MGRIGLSPCGPQVTSWSAGNTTSKSDLVDNDLLNRNHRITAFIGHRPGTWLIHPSPHPLIDPPSVTLSDLSSSLQLSLMLNSLPANSPGWSVTIKQY